MGKQSKGHAIMISVPYQGHINPFINLALKLASKGFTITFAHLEFVHQKLSKAHHSSEVDLFSEARESGLDIRYATISDGFPLEFDRDANFDEYWEIILRDFAGLVDKFIGKTIQSEPFIVPFLVTDIVFYPWPATIADKYNIVNVSFWTQPALVFSLACHWELLRENGHFPCKDPAVGGFLTHNGWNSTVESMWCGVPMICYPIAYDQITNAKLVVDDWKIGIRLCDHGMPVDRKEVAEKIKSFINGDSISKSLRVEADKVKATMRDALETDGSSERNFDQFVKDLEEKIISTITNVKKCDQPARDVSTNQ